MLHSQTRSQWQWIESTRKQKMSKKKNLYYSSWIWGETGWLAHQIARYMKTEKERTTKLWPKRETPRNLTDNEMVFELYLLSNFLNDSEMVMCVCASAFVFVRWFWTGILIKINQMSHWIHRKASSSHSYIQRKRWH